MTDDDTQPQPGDQAEIDARIDLAFALATYLHKYPGTGLPLRQRINNLATDFSEAELDLLTAETEFWLDVIATDEKKNG